MDCDSAGVFLFTPFIEKLNLAKVVKDAGLPGSRFIPALNYFFSFLSVKLIGTERFAHMNDHSFDAWGLGLFAGLNVLPKCTAMSTYAYSLDAIHLLKLQNAFVRQADRIGLYDKSVINLDFHTIPHFGDESVLQKHWAGARNKTMKGALTLMGRRTPLQSGYCTRPLISSARRRTSKCLNLYRLGESLKEVLNPRWCLILSLPPMPTCPSSTGLASSSSPCAAGEKS